MNVRIIEKNLQALSNNFVNDLINNKITEEDEQKAQLRIDRIRKILNECFHDFTLSSNKTVTLLREQHLYK